MPRGFIYYYERQMLSIKLYHAIIVGHGLILEMLQQEKYAF